MTIREAISVLNQINSIISQDESWSETAKKAYSDAVSMATNALESHEVTADPDTVSRQQAIDGIVKLMPTENGTYNMWDVFGALKELPPSPSRPQEHEKLCEGCEWEDDAYSQCQRCTRNYADFYQEKRNGGAV